MVKVHSGEAVSAGIAVGPVRLVGYEAAERAPQRIPGDQVEVELNSLRAALEVSRQQIEALKGHHEGSLGENELRIFDVHIAYLRDPMFIEEIEKLVVRERYSVRAAIRKVADDYDRIFQLVENDYLRQRAGDFRDVATRLIRNLEPGVERVAPREQSGRYVLAARRLSVNDLFQLDNSLVDGIVTEEGGVNSHAAILARSMGIPTITGIGDLPGKLSDGVMVIVDAGAGELHVDPDERLCAEFAEAARRLESARRAMPTADQSHETRDGTPVRILAACGNLAEVNMAQAYGMAGVGVYRTELLFLVEKRLPGEDALVHHYREVMADPKRPAWLRLLDVAPGSGVAGLPPAEGRNPALGLRGVRALLGRQTLLRAQLRAILRAAAHTHNAAVLIPFVTGLTDIQRVRAAILEERQELRRRGIECAETLAVAPIVEVPAAAIICRTLLAESDFLVVGLDDLQALLVAADRDSAQVRDYYGMPHPAMFELLTRMAKEARAAEKPVVLFGEVAADPVRLPFYLGVGYRDFAIAPVNVAAVLDVLGRVTIDQCESFAEELQEAPRALDAQRILLRSVGQVQG
jgi:phosphotransferase system enzyme I (PtsI)